MATLAESARETERIERERLEREPSFVTAMSSSPVDSPPTDTEEDSCLPSSLAVEGRVFRRLQRFQLLASELKAQSDMVTTYLLTPKVRLHVFEQRKHWWQHPLHLAKAGQGTFILGRQLLKAILKYLLLSHAANNSLRDAQQLAEALILSGFLSPAHEAPNVDDEPIEELYIFDDSYYELVAPGATAVVRTPNVVVSAAADSSQPDTVVLPAQRFQVLKKPSLESEHSLSVWALTDGATRAGFVQRKRGRIHVRNILGFRSKLSRCYAVVNKTKHHSLVLFETDVARRDLVRVNLPTVSVEYYAPTGDDSSRYALKIRTESDRDDDTEILVLQSKPEQEQWLVALIDAGAAFLETHAAILSFAASTASLYSLRDTDASGNTFCLSELRGHVALLTNVSSGTCSSNAKQLQQLEELSSKYVDAGLTVVAFPSAQFGDGEFGNDEDLVEYFHELFGVNFPVLATRDVNGPSARDAMLFCKTRLPGAAKSAANAFIENNYVKFLVGRDGHLFKRYGACDLPLSMETDIQNLLQATPPESRP
ncbi:Glutathione peroxidase [Phytophthora infestans]|nr:Glutathione peroxidase [Phytophthora infestans]